MTPFPPISEARGGACNSEVVLSSKEIAYIKTRKLDALVVMSQPAMDQYRKRVIPDHTRVIYDETLVNSIPPDFKHTQGIGATHLAEKEFGRSLYANIIMLGALLGTDEIPINLEEAEEEVRSSFPSSKVELNLTALKRGFNGI